MNTIALFPTGWSTEDEAKGSRDETVNWERGGKETRAAEEQSRGWCWEDPSEKGARSGTDRWKVSVSPCVCMSLCSFFNRTFKLRMKETVILVHSKVIRSGVSLLRKSSGARTNLSLKKIERKLTHWGGLNWSWHSETFRAADLSKSAVELV